MQPRVTFVPNPLDSRPTAARSRYMRRMAINYLTRRNDPRTQKLLMELIEK